MGAQRINEPSAYVVHAGGIPAYGGEPIAATSLSPSRHT
jgi:hypothetical protein